MGKQWPRFLLNRCSPNLISFISIVVAGLILSLPVIVAGFPGMADDGPVHGIWSRNFIAEWRLGDWHPRWLTSMNHGRGSPVFFFYAPWAYWVTSVLTFGTTEQLLPYHAMGRSVALALVLSGLTCYLWLKTIASRKAALLGSLLYIILPYHLAIDLYARAAIGEFWAFAWTPLAFYFAQKIVTTRRRVKVLLLMCGLAMSICLVLLTHLPTALILTPFFLMYVLFGKGQFDLHRITSLVVSFCGLALGICLAAFFLAPALLLRSLVGLQSLGESINPYDNFFLSFRTADTPRDFLYSTLLAAALSVVSFLFIQRASAKGSKLHWCLMIMVVAAGFMTVSPSRIIWRHIHILQIVQFPWRFNVVICLASVALSAVALTQFAKYNASARKIFGAFITCLVIGTIFITFRRVKDDFLTRSASAIEAVDHISKRQIADPVEFRTIWAKNAVDKLESPFPATGSTFEPVARLNKPGTTLLRSRKPRELIFEVGASRPSQMTVQHFYFPCWRSYIIKEPMDSSFPGISSPITPTPIDGFMRISVPAGRHFVVLRLEPTAEEIWGRKISMAALIVVLVITGWSGGHNLLRTFKKP